MKRLLLLKWSYLIFINTIGLKFLVRVCTDLGLKEAQEYAGKLKKAEKAKEAKQQRANSANRSGVSSRQSGSAGSGKIFILRLWMTSALCNHHYSYDNEAYWLFIERAGSGRNTSRNSSAKMREDPDPIHQEESKEIGK